MTNQLEKALENLGFSSLESKLYLVLTDKGTLSPYQLAKQVNISRSSVYNALEHMYEKGMVERIAGETLSYKAQNTDVLLNKLNLQFSKNLHTAKKELKQFKESSYQEKFANLNGSETILCKAREQIKNTKRELYISTDFPLEALEAELKEAGGQVPVTVFSFYDLQVPKNIRFFSHRRPVTKQHIPSRFALVCDREMILLADIQPERNAWNGVITNNRLMIQMISEHIHNDIYLLKIKERYGKNIYADSLFIQTDFENRQRGVF